MSNPKLLPKLTSDIPNDLLQKDGIADAELAKKEAERGRKRKADEDESLIGSRKRSRSISSYSSDSISTISTNLSRSSSANLTAGAHTGQSQQLSKLNVDRKRGRDRSTSMSCTSDSSHGKRPSHRLQHPAKDGRSVRTLGDRNSYRVKSNAGRQRRSLSPNSVSYTSDTSFEGSRKENSHSNDRGKRRRHSSRSPVDRGRDRDGWTNRVKRKTRSPSRSRNRSEVVRNRKSMTPSLATRHDIPSNQDHRPPADRGDGYSRDNDRYGSSARDRSENGRGGRKMPNARSPRRKRSLSPFSKRLALTQAMNMGH